MKYVDAATTAEKISDKFNIPMAELVDVFAEIPAADVQPVKRGKWYGYLCSECNAYADYFISGDIWFDEKPKYCPKCGADMRGDTE